MGQATNRESNADDSTFITSVRTNQNEVTQSLKALDLSNSVISKVDSTNHFVIADKKQFAQLINLLNEWYGAQDPDINPPTASSPPRQSNSQQTSRSKLDPQILEEVHRETSTYSDSASSAVSGSPQRKKDKKFY